MSPLLAQSGHGPSEFAVVHNAAHTHGCGSTKFLWESGNRARFARAIAIGQCPLLEPGHDLAQIGAYLLKCSTFAAAFGEAEEADARGGQCAS